jgi:quercetin 2,3-dioxygenase
MSGPVDVADTQALAEEEVPAPANERVEVIEGRSTTVGHMPVRRVLPRRTRRTVGAWCFVDHMGPLAVSEPGGVDIGPHPHLGLHTVTWLIAGELVHHDSIGSEQTIRPGQLNLMTAGHGIAHAEESTTGYVGDVHGVQLWVAQPERTRHDKPAFEHHAELPQVSLGAGTATLLIGAFLGEDSPARADTPLLGVEAVLPAGVTTLPLDTSYEHGVVVLSGEVSIDDALVTPGHLGYLSPGRDELAMTIDDDARILLLGGEPFEEQILIWWNYVARSQDEIDVAGQEWNAQILDNRSRRFGRPVLSSLDAIPSPVPPWKAR